MPSPKRKPDPKRTPATDRQPVITISGNVVQMEPCHHPHCRMLVRSSYRMKLCTEHAHTPNLCTCIVCHRRDALAAEAARQARVEAARKRPGIRAFTPPAITFGDGNGRTVAVSLLAEPWWADEARA